MEIWKKISKKTNTLLGFKCDTCGKVEPLPKYTFGISVKGEITNYHFDKLQCAAKFIADELKKERPADDRFIYGKGERV